MVESIQHEVLTAVEYEAVDTDFLISLDANLGDQLGFPAKCCDGCQEPAITQSTLAYIISGCAIYVELRVFEDVLTVSV